MKRLATALLVLALLGLTAPAAQAGRHGLTLAGAVNDERRAHGASALRLSPGLARSAGRYARSLLDRDVFEHGARISAPWRFRLLGENLALLPGHGAWPRRVVRMWMRSPAHRRVLLDPRMRKLGAGRATGRFRGSPATIWVLHVGRLR
jgi:uncharacterized protein YkwD